MLAALCAPCAGSLQPGATQTNAVSAPPEPMHRVLLTDALAQRSIVLVSITADTITIRDDKGRLASLPRAGVLAILPAVRANAPESSLDAAAALVTSSSPTARGAADDAAAIGMLRLADGQAFPGSLDTTTRPGNDAIAWSNQLWGTLTLPLESIRSISLRSSASAADGPDTKDDRIVLANGDVLTGFVESIGASVRLEREGKPTDVPLDRVQSISLASTPAPASGVRAWMADGTITRIADVQITTTGRALFTAPKDLARADAGSAGATGEPTSVEAAGIRALLFRAEAIAPLAGLTLTSAPLADAASSPTPGEASGRRWVPAARVLDATDAALGAADIELPGPMTLEVPLPANARRAAFIAELPESCFAWGDCTLTVEGISPSGDVSLLAQSRMNARSPVADVNIPTGPATQLRFRLDPGPSGPIQDRILLRRGLVLVGQ